MITIGASVFLRGVAQIVFDKRFHSLPPLFGADAIQFGGAAILPQSFVVLVGTGVIVILLWLFVERTLLGKAVIATRPIDWRPGLSASIRGSSSISRLPSRRRSARSPAF